MEDTLSPKLYFSYSQFMIYDEDELLPGCNWTEQHSAQGFARRESVVNFATLLEFGSAVVHVFSTSYQPRDQYNRVIAVPFRVSSGIVMVGGPEEFDLKRNFKLSPGYYRLVAAQYVVENDEEIIDLYFESRSLPLEQSTLLVVDALLNPPKLLIEDAGIAGDE